MTVQGRPVSALQRRIAALEKKRREQVQTELDGSWISWSMDDYGMTADELIAHQRVLVANAAAQLGVEAEDLLSLLRVLGVLPAVGTPEQVEAAAERLSNALRAAALEIFVWRSGRAYLRQEGESDLDVPPFDRDGWRPWEKAHPDLAAEFLRLRAELRRLES